MNAFLIGLAWLAGTMGGGVIAIGILGFVWGRVLFNPRRIDWSVREARFIGLGLAVLGFCSAAYLVVGTLLLSSSQLPPAWFPLVDIVMIPVGMIVITFVGPSHNRRNPSKKW